MDVVRFICEFFFGNFWHWLGLLVMLCIVCNVRLLTFSINKNDKNREEEK